MAHFHDAKLYFVFPSDDILIHGEIRGMKYHEGRTVGLAMEVRVSVMLRDLLGVLDVATAVCKWGGNTGEVQSLTS
jgi:hypothetical protein